MTTKTPISNFTITGKWHMGPPAPNGSVPGQLERVVDYVEIYLADYYGRGAKEYATVKTVLQGKGWSSTINLSSIGNPADIERLRSQAD